jgi:hypothetical protein
MRYVPSGTRQVPPPAAQIAKALIKAAVSFVTPSPTAPYSLTLTTWSPLDEFWIAGVLTAGVTGSRSFWEYPLGKYRTTKTLAATIRKDRCGYACPINRDMNLETTF